MNGNAALAALRRDFHTSVAAIETYRQCSKKFELHYLRKVPPEHRPVQLAFGSAVHAGLSIFYESLKNSRLKPSLDELQAGFVESWKDQLDSGQPILMGESDTPESLERLGLDMIRVFHESAPVPYRVLGSEEAFSVELDDVVSGRVFEERLVGSFDGVAEDEPGNHVVIEIKTASRRWSMQRLQDDLQLSAYSWVAPLVGLKNVSICLLILIKSTPPKLEIFHPRRDKKDHQMFLNVAAGVLRGIRAGAFYQALDWRCKTCPYHQSCRSL